MGHLRTRVHIRNWVYRLRCGTHLKRFNRRTSHYGHWWRWYRLWRFHLRNSTVPS